MILVKFSIDRMLSCNMQLSITKRRWHNYVKFFVYAKYREIYLLNLVLTLFYLRLVSFYIKDLILHRGELVFIDKRSDTFVLLRYLKLETGQRFIGNFWVSGSFTNFKEFHKERVLQLSNSFLSRTGYFSLTRLPDFVVTFSFYENEVALNETRTLGIPAVSVVGSDMNTSGFAFILPSNDIFKKSLFLISQVLKLSILKGYSRERFLFYFLLKRFCFLFFIKNNLLNI